VLVLLGLGTAACSDDDGDLEAFCAGIAEHRDELMAITPEQSEAEARAALPAVLDAYDEIVDHAPREVRGPARRLRDLLHEIAEVDPDDDAAYGRAVLELLEEDTQRDAVAFTTYVQEHCGVDLTSPATR